MATAREFLSFIYELQPGTATKVFCEDTLKEAGIKRSTAISMLQKIREDIPHYTGTFKKQGTSEVYIYVVEYREGYTSDTDLDNALLQRAWS